MVKRPRCRTKISLIYILFLSAFLVSIVTPGVAEPARSENKVTKTRSLNSELFTQQDVLETIVSQINEPRFTWFDSILVNNIGPRPYDSNSNVQAAEFIAEELNATKSISTTYQWFTYEDKKIANVIGVLPSANPNNQSKIVVGAHFDTVPNSPGADDNGSGTALLLEVAKVLSQFRFNCTIEFVAFNAEEVGLVGSGYYAQQASQAGEDILFVINVDMCIWDNPDAPPNEKLWIVYQGTVPYEDCECFADLTLDIGYTYTTAPIQKISSTNDTYVPVYNWRRSDQASFWDAGIPALWIFEFNGFQNPYMHKPADSMDVESYNFTLGTQAAQVVAATIAKLATPLIIVPDQYEKIQWAIGNASDGDTIFVRAGTYYEHVVVDKSVSLIGENKHNTVIDGNETGTVVYVTANNVTISGFTIRNSGFPSPDSGIYVDHSRGNNISHNIVTNCVYGIYLYNSSNNVLIDNNASNNLYNFGVSGRDFSDFNNYVDTSNTVDGKPIYYLIGVADAVYDAKTNAGTIYLINCNNITIKDLTLTKNYFGALFFNTTNSKIENVTASNNEYNIYFLYSSNNVILHNNFADSPKQVGIEYSSSITWDDGYPSGGNYWSNHTGIDLYSGPHQNETGSDGISDTPYTIDANNKDRYPLMGPVNAFDAGTWNNIAYHVNVASNSTVSDLYFNPDEGAFIRFNVTGPDGTTGFCRVAIPKQLLRVESGQWLVLVGDGPVIPTVTEDDDYTYLYFTYNHSTKTVQITGTDVIPEFPPALILPVFMILSLIAITLAKRKTDKPPSSY